MHAQLRNLRLLNGRQILAVGTVVLLLCASLAGMFSENRADAANLSTINFQARLMDDNGSIAADGNYNLEFKLYNAAAPDGGETPNQGACTTDPGNAADEDCVWVETRTGGNTVVVANGYVTVNLGSVTSFGTSINWNQDLWLTMRVGGTGTPSWDDEMSPRLKLTAVPYAFRAAQLALQTGVDTSVLRFDTQTQANDIRLPDEGGVLCIQGSADCGFVEGSAADFIQNQNAGQQGSSNFWISGNGRADVALQAPLFDTPTAVALNIGTTNATQINLNKNTFIAANQDLTLQNGDGVFSQTFASSSAASAHVLSATNTSSSGSIAVNGYDITLVGTATSGTNTNSALHFANPSAVASNAFYGLNFAGTGYTDILRVGSNQIINGSGVVQSVGINGSYTGITGVGTLTVGTWNAGTIGTQYGGTGATSFTQYGVMYGNGTGALQVTAAGSTGQCLVGNTGGAPTWTSCSFSAGDVFEQGGNDFNADAVLGTTDADKLILITNNTTRATFDTSNNLYLGNGVTAASPSNFTIQGTGSTTTAVAGGSLTVRGGSATVGTANGGNVTITGGTGVGGGVLGLVSLAPTTFVSSGTAQTFNGGSGCPSCNVTGVDTYSSIAVNAATVGLSIGIPVPNALNQVVGRILYVTAVSGSQDFAIVLGGTSISINMKANSTATLIWNGTGWTAAGASSSTDLQSAYNNTLASAGTAELLLNAPGGNADGLTIRNNATTPIVGGLLEVQTSIGSNLLSVNNNATEYANNGGAESSTFSMWSQITAGTVSRYTTVDSNVATGIASVFVDGSSTANTGVKNTLAAALTPNLQYTVSFAVRHTSTTATFTTLDVKYSNDGTSVSSACTTGATVTNGRWTRITCNFTAPSAGINSSNAIFITHSDGSDHDFYIDNLSVTINASTNNAADGSVSTGSLGSNWVAFGAGSSVTLEGTNIYDTSGSVKVDTTNNTDRGVTNNLTITPSVSTQYLVTFYAKLGSGTFTDIRVRYSRDGGTNFVSCVDYNTRTLSTSNWNKITCLLTTDSTTATNPDLIIDQPTAPGGTRTFYVDALTVTLNSNTASNIQIGGGSKGGPPTLLTLDRSAGPPIAANNDAYLGSMYYDTTTGRIQCYEVGGWGACGAPPDNIVNLNPEYAGAVLNGTGIGTMTADFCARQTSISFLVNTSICGNEGEARNYYKWTSPQASPQTYSIYVTYQLPATFNGFASDDTIQLAGRVDNTSNASVKYQMYAKTTNGLLSQCWNGVDSETTVATSNNTWQSVGINGNEATSCGLNSSYANGFIIFKVNLTASSNATAYASTLSFTTTGR